MKKILALVFSLGALTTVIGQKVYSEHDRGRSRDMAHRGPGDHDGSVDRRPGKGSYHFTARERDAQIHHINRAFDLRIMDVKRDRRLGHGEKKRTVRALEGERSERIRQVNRRYASQHDYHKNRNERKNRRGRS